jgi:SAM-dependent methyltransferase
VPGGTGATSECFIPGWLALRESEDRRARDYRLTHAAAAWLSRRPGPHRLLDLGAGSGNNPRFLAERLPGPQVWRLVDRDSVLLAQACRDAGAWRDRDGGPVETTSNATELEGLSQSDFDAVDLVTASALLDLLARPHVERIARASVAAGAAALFVLSVDGTWYFTSRDGRPGQSQDDRLAGLLFTAHQRRDKGQGLALGAGAPALLGLLYRRLGYRVFMRRSAWRLAAGSAAAMSLGIALLEQRLAAICEQAPELAGRLESWGDARRDALASGSAGMVVGHVDLFARPSPAAD